MLTATRSGLGIAVNEIQRTLGGGRMALGSVPVRSPRWTNYPRGPGLGDVPNDFEAGYDLQYTPVRQGWYVGYPVTGGGYYSSATVNLGDDGAAAVSSTTAAATVVPPVVGTDAAATRRDQIRTALQVVATLSSVAVGIVLVTKAVREGRGRRART